MIDLKDSQITQILPENLAKDPKVIALSYAINNAVERLISYADKTSVYAVIDKLPEDILDILAVELRTQYYDSTLSIDIKKNLIKNTMPWYSKSGTVSAVQEMIDKVFDDGVVLEWFKTGQAPGTFQISTTVPIDQDLIERFKQQVNNVKNIRSHLSGIVVGNISNGTYYCAVGIASHYVIQIK